MVNKTILSNTIIKDGYAPSNKSKWLQTFRSTPLHILALRRLIERIESHNRQAIIIYVDFKKAFDSVYRKMLLKTLKASDTPPRLLKAIAKIYENTKAKEIIPDGKTDFFKVKAGVLQGDTLAPYLFAIVLDYVMRETYRGREDELGFKLQK